MNKVVITSLGLLETTEGVSIPRGGIYGLSIASHQKEIIVLIKKYDTLLHDWGIMIVEIFSFFG